MRFASCCDAMVGQLSRPEPMFWFDFQSGDVYCKGIPERNIRSRIRIGWTVEEAIGTPLGAERGA